MAGVAGVWQGIPVSVLRGMLSELPGDWIAFIDALGDITFSSPDLTLRYGYIDILGEELHLPDEPLDLVQLLRG